MTIYKCQRCGKVSLAENGFTCHVCGSKTIRFNLPKIDGDFGQEPNIARLVLTVVGAGILFICLGIVVALAMAM